MLKELLKEESLLGFKLGHYRITEKIGSGGMGVVYRAHDEHLDREAAVKVLHPGTIADETARRRFRNEAFALSKLNHPNIATIHDFDTQQGMDFLVMEYLPGVTLTEKLASGPLPEELILPLGLQLCEGLAAAHEHGVVHRDLKPGNLRLTSDGRLKILDFGLAKQQRSSTPNAATESELPSQAFTGTLAYMAPEQLLGEPVDARTDIYAAGLVLYEMATGQRPYAEVDTGKLIGTILRSAPIPPTNLNPSLRPELERIIAKCLEKDPAHRYQSAKELAAALQSLRDGKQSESRTQGSPGARPWFPVRLNRRWVLGGAAILVAWVAAATLYGPARRQLGSWRQTGPMPRAKQVAVLPFSVVGDDPETGAFSAGLTETLTAKLTQLTGDPSLQVVPATEIRAKHVTTVEDARKEFGVNLVMEGNLYKSGERVRINSILVDARTRLQLRADSLTVAAADPFAAQDAVVNGTVRMLELKVEPHKLQALSSHGTQVAGAYDYYLQGRGYLQNYDRPENLDSAVQVFQQALALDPGYALAFAGLGDAYWMKYQNSKDVTWIPKSREACLQASRLESRLPSAHVCLGKMQAGTGSYQEAAREFEIALENEPTNDSAFHGLADAYEHLGKLQDAEKTYRRAIELRPHYWATYNWLGVFFFRQARFAEAVEMFNQVVALAPDSFLGYSNLGAAYVEQASYVEAITALKRSIAIRPTDYGYSNLGNAYFFLRRYEEADHAFEQAVQMTGKDSLLWWNLGDGYYWTPGKRSQSVVAYRKAIAIAKDELHLNPSDSHAYGILAICHAMLGERTPALDALQRGFRVSPDDPFLQFHAALVYAQFGQSEEAIQWLKRAVKSGYSPLRIRDFPNFDPLRANPQFQELIRAKTK